MNEDDHPLAHLERSFAFDAHPDLADLAAHGFDDHFVIGGGITPNLTLDLDAVPGPNLPVSPQERLAEQNAAKDDTVGFGGQLFELEPFDDGAIGWGGHEQSHEDRAH